MHQPTKQSLICSQDLMNWSPSEWQHFSLEDVYFLCASVTAVAVFKHCHTQKKKLTNNEIYASCAKTFSLYRSTYPIQKQTYFLNDWSPVSASAPLSGQWKDLAWWAGTLGAFCSNCTYSICCLKGCRIGRRERMIETHDLSTWCWHQLIVSVFCRNRWLCRYYRISKVWSCRIWAGLLPSDVTVI